MKLIRVNMKAPKGYLKQDEILRSAQVSSTGCVTPFHRRLKLPANHVFVQQITNANNKETSTPRIIGSMCDA